VPRVVPLPTPRRSSDRDSRPTKPAAAAAVLCGKSSRIMGEALSKIPIPAVTLVNNTIHSSQICGVRKAPLAATLALVRIFEPVRSEEHTSGLQSRFDLV